MSYLRDFTSLLFPAYCAVCERNLIQGEEVLCLGCQIKLPRTYMHEENDNRLERIFWGRVDVRCAAAFLKMPRNGAVHHLIHQLKYHDNKQVGLRLGKLFGHELKSSPRMREFDIIIPVPLHPKKLYLRGYNQCDFIADGLESGLGCAVMRNNLQRVHHNSSQTRKSRYARWTNVETIFQVHDQSLLTGKRVLLVDDVITTGATIEACAQVLNAIPGLSLCVASLAMPA